MDAGRNFSSSKFRESGIERGDGVEADLTEAHDCIGLIKKSHANMQTVYNKQCMDHSNKSIEERSSLAFRSSNDTANSDTGIFPTTLMLGIYLKVPGSRARQSQYRAQILFESILPSFSGFKARMIVGDAQMP